MKNKYHYYHLIINGKEVDLNDEMIVEIFNKLNYDLIAKILVFNSRNYSTLDKDQIKDLAKKVNMDYGTYYFNHIGENIPGPVEHFILEAIDEVYNDINYRNIIDFLLINYSNLLETSNQSIFMQEIKNLLKIIRAKMIMIFNEDIK